MRLTAPIIVVLILVWFVPSWFVAARAERKGYSFVIFFLFGLCFSWLIALLVTEVVSDRGGRRVRCPECAERVLAEASVCKHCGARLDEEDTDEHDLA
jgi:hypothetical protein